MQVVQPEKGLIHRPPEITSHLVPTKGASMSILSHSADCTKANDLAKSANGLLLVLPDMSFYIGASRKMRRGTGTVRMHKDYCGVVASLLGILCRVPKKSRAPVWGSF